MADFLIPKVLSQTPAPFPAGSEGAVQAALGQLLLGRCRLYTMGESSSLPAQTVEELAESLRFVLSLALREPGVSPTDLLSGKGEAILARGFTLAEGKLTAVKALYEKVRHTMPPVENSFLNDTLASIPPAVRLYDIRYFAHRIPAEIDYPLALPISEELLGVEYLWAYLWRLHLEGDFLSRFPAHTLGQLLSMQNPDYADMPLNLFEPAFRNALGRALLGQRVQPLLLSKDGLERLCETLLHLPKKELEKQVLTAVDRMVVRLSLSEPGQLEYLWAVARDLLPHLREHLRAGSGARVFTAE